MRQSRLGSLVEVSVNIAIGFGINWMANILVLPLFGFYVTGAQAFSIGLIFTVISVARSYVVRRYFEQRIHQAAMRLMKGEGMAVADTSIEAYREHKGEGLAGKQAETILKNLKEGKDYSRREIARELGMELSSVCGRVNELLQVGLLEEAPKRRCSVTHKTIHPVMKGKGLNAGSV